MTTLTKADIPASIRGLDWIEVTDENLKRYEGCNCLIAFPNPRDICCIDIGTAARFSGEIVFIGEDYSENEIVDYFVPII